MKHQKPRWVALKQWVARPSYNLSVVSSNPIKVSRCFLDQETTHIALVLVGSRNGL